MPHTGQVPEATATPWAELTALREQRGLTVSELARLVNRSQSHLWRVENGERQPAPRLLTHLATALNVDLKALQDSYHRLIT